MKQGGEVQHCLSLDKCLIVDMYAEDRHGHIVDFQNSDFHDEACHVGGCASS